MAGSDFTRELNKGDTHNTTISLIFETLFYKGQYRKPVSARA